MEPLIRQIAGEIRDRGGEAWFAGGHVRDRLLERAGADFDVEVYGLPLEDLEALLRVHGRVQAVGRAFGVLKFTAADGEADFSLPRRENKEGRGHRGFVVDLDPAIEPEEACARRDFTVNAMLENVLDGRVLDVMCRVPDGRREWRRARLVVMGISDMRSRSLCLQVAATENSDGILAGHFCQHVPQPVHLSASTERALSRILAT